MLRQAVVYTAACSPRSQTDAARGGPMGEVLMTRALIDGLRALGPDPTVLTSLKSFVLHRVGRGLGRLLGADPIYFLDPWTLALACDYRLLSADDARQLFVLEWFGTPPSRVEPRLPALSADRYLLPYPDDFGWNTFLGFTVDVAPSFDRKKPQGIVWGKDAKYLQGDAAAVLDRLAADCELHATVAGAGAAALPPGVVNHGVLDHDAWVRLLHESSFVIGLGDPIGGPTAIEALASGCAYLNPVYPGLRHVNGIAELAIRSQHPFAARLGEPFVFDIDLRHPDAVATTALGTLDPCARRAEENRLRTFLEPFSADAFRARLRGVMEIA